MCILHPLGNSRVIVQPRFSTLVTGNGPTHCCPSLRARVNSVRFLVDNSTLSPTLWSAFGRFLSYRSLASSLATATHSATSLWICAIWAALSCGSSGIFNLSESGFNSTSQGPSGLNPYSASKAEHCLDLCLFEFIANSSSGKVSSQSDFKPFT